MTGTTRGCATGDGLAQEARAIDGAGVLTLRSRLVSAGIQTFYAPSAPPS